MTNQSVESRLAALERMVGLGGVGAGVSVDELADQLKRATLQIAALTTAKTVGNVLGGMIRTEIAPGLVPIGPFRMDVDSTYGLEFDLWISDKVLKIKTATLRLKPGASRLATAVGGSSSASTTAAEGETAVNVETAAHVHLWATRLNVTASVVGTAVLTSPGPGSVNVPTVGDFDQYRTYDSSGAATQSMDMLTVSGFTSHYTAVSAGGTVSVAPAGHTHGMTHHHDVTLGISESGAAAGLHLYIDGVDRTASLSGPWSAVIELDILQYLVNARLEPVIGAHHIKVTSTAAGAVEATGDMYVVIKAIS